MTGFDADGINAEFFGDGRLTVLAVVNIGKPGEDAWFGRSPRLDYEDAVELGVRERDDLSPTRGKFPVMGTLEKETDASGVNGGPGAPAAGPPRWLTAEEQAAWRAHLATSKLLTRQLDRDLHPFGLMRFSDDAGGLARRPALRRRGRAGSIPRSRACSTRPIPAPTGSPPIGSSARGARPARRGRPGRVVVQAVERHLADPAVAAFAAAIADQGMIYQSDAFGTTLAQLFDLARLLGSERPRPRPPAGRGGPCPASCSTARAAPASAAGRPSSTRRPTAARRRWRSPRATS